MEEEQKTKQQKQQKQQKQLEYYSRKTHRKLLSWVGDENNKIIEKKTIENLDKVGKKEDNVMSAVS